MERQVRMPMALLVLLAGGYLPVSSADAGDLQPVSTSEFEKLRRELQPSPKEGWRTIPWKISLLEGQRLAAEQRKPIFIWAMDGHPLGCT